MSWGAVIVGAIGVGTSIYKTSQANKQKREDEAQKKAIKPAFYKIQDEYFQNRDLAGNLAESGLPSSTKDYLTAQDERGFSAGLNAITSGGGDTGDVAKLFGSYANSINNTGAQDAMQKIKNIEYFTKVNSDLAGQKNIKWALNEKQPHDELLKQLNQDIAVDEKNRQSGIDQTIGAGTQLVGAAASGIAMNSLYNKLFPKETDPYKGQDRGTPQMFDNYPTSTATTDTNSSFGSDSNFGSNSNGLTWNQPGDINGRQQQTPTYPGTGNNSNSWQGSDDNEFWKNFMFKQ